MKSTVLPFFLTASAVAFGVLVTMAFYESKDHGYRAGLGYPATTNQLVVGHMYGVVNEMANGSDQLLWLAEPSEPRRGRIFQFGQPLTKGLWYFWGGTNFVLAIPGKDAMAMSFSPLRSGS